tara:strand:- start:3054 stop:3899 length:846 start_codon:yes stop_codon:yes gene_type:complete
MYAQAINISLHDHDNADYGRLIRDIFELEIRVNYRSDDFIMISSLREQSGLFYGTFARFVEIRRDGDWFDLTTHEKAEDQVLAAINIPPDLFPNLSTFLFRFDPDRHLLIFESYGLGKTLSPNVVKDYFEEVLQQTAILSRFGGAEVSVVADHDQLDEIFKFDRLTRVKMLIRRPNSDHESDDFERDVLAEMAAEGVRQLEIERVAIEGTSMRPSDRTRAYAKVAAQNGEVRTHGIEDGATKTKSTDNIPLRDGEPYDPEDVSEQNILDRLASRLTQKFIS